VRDKIWQHIESFAGFSFCKAHAAQFAILAYQSAYLKAHHTAEFFAARLSNEGGYYAPDVYIRDARRFGMSIELPEVNRSEKTYEGRESRIVMGLQQVRCLTETEVDSILLARNADGPFRSVADFLARTGTGYEHTHALIRVEAFRSMHAPRPLLLGELAEAIRARIHRPGQARQPLLFTGSHTTCGVAHDQDPTTSGGATGVVFENTWARDYTLFEQIQAEVDVLGMIVSIHPMEPLQGAIRASGLLPATETKQYDGKRVRMGGLIVSYKTVLTRKSEPMAMITMEDLTGMFDAVVFPEDYRRYASVLRGNNDQGLCFEGKVQVEYGAATLIVDKVEPLNKALKLSGTPRNISVSVASVAPPLVVESTEEETHTVSVISA